MTSLEESGELMSSELASVQADLATAQSLVNTHQLAAEKVRGWGGISLGSVLCVSDLVFLYLHSIHIALVITHTPCC